jgi:hypothetical protein
MNDDAFKRIIEQRDLALEALDHIARVAAAGMHPTRRLDWITKRARRAAHQLPPDSDDRPPPENMTIRELRAQLRCLLSEVRKHA